MDHSSHVWQLEGLTASRPGWLELVGGQLRFSADEVTIFETTLGALSEVRFPWYYFGGGVKFTVAGTRYRFSFIRPNNAMVAPGPRAYALPAARAAWKRWQEILRPR